MLTFRELYSSDFSQICIIYQSVFTPPPWNDDWSDSHQLREYILDLTASTNSLSIGAFEDDKLCAASLGHLMHWWSGTQYYIHEFFVDEKMQGNGIGSALLAYIETTLIEKQIKDIFLHTDRTYHAFEF